MREAKTHLGKLCQIQSNSGSQCHSLEVNEKKAKVLWDGNGRKSMECCPHNQTVKNILFRHQNSSYPCNPRNTIYKNCLLPLIVTSLRTRDKELAILCPPPKTLAYNSHSLLIIIIEKNQVMTWRWETRNEHFISSSNFAELFFHQDINEEFNWHWYRTNISFMVWSCSGEITKCNLVNTWTNAKRLRIIETH